MRTITTREQVLVNGTAKERVATHIVTGAHGFDTLCTDGCTCAHNDEGKLIKNSEMLAEGELPVTCYTCWVIWRDVHTFQPGDFDTESGKGSFFDTGLSEITLGQIAEQEPADAPACPPGLPAGYP